MTKDVDGIDTKVESMLLKLMTRSLVTVVLETVHDYMATHAEGTIRFIVKRVTRELGMADRSSEVFFDASRWFTRQQIEQAALELMAKEEDSYAARRCAETFIRNVHPTASTNEIEAIVRALYDSGRANPCQHCNRVPADGVLHGEGLCERCWKAALAPEPTSPMSVLGPPTFMSVDWGIPEGDKSVVLQGEMVQKQDEPGVGEFPEMVFVLTGTSQAEERALKELTEEPEEPESDLKPEPMVRPRQTEFHKLLSMAEELRAVAMSIRIPKPTKAVRALSTELQLAERDEAERLTMVRRFEAHKPLIDVVQQLPKTELLDLAVAALDHRKDWPLDKNGLARGNRWTEIVISEKYTEAALVHTIVSALSSKEYTNHMFNSIWPVDFWSSPDQIRAEVNHMLRLKRCFAPRSLKYDVYFRTLGEIGWRPYSWSVTTSEMIQSGELVPVHVDPNASAKTKKPMKAILGLFRGPNVLVNDPRRQRQYGSILSVRGSSMNMFHRTLAKGTVRYGEAAVLELTGMMFSQLLECLGESEMLAPATEVRTFEIADGIARFIEEQHRKEDGWCRIHGFPVQHDNEVWTFIQKDWLFRCVLRSVYRVSGVSPQLW